MIEVASKPEGVWSGVAGYRAKLPSSARRRLLEPDSSDDPTSAVANLFDLAILIGVGLLVMALSSFGLKDLLSNDQITIVKNPGQPNMELIRKKGNRIERLTGTGQKIKVEGTPIGTVYRLPNGDVVWMPKE